MEQKPANFEEWVRAVHDSIRTDPLWDFQVYQRALFLYDLAWQDCDYLLREERGHTVASQLIRSAGSISANIEEGYGRGYGKDYSLHLRIALAEARESRGWYWRGRHRMPPEVVNHRIKLLDEIIAMLAPNVVRQRNYKAAKASGK